MQDFPSAHPPHLNKPSQFSQKDFSNDKRGNPLKMKKSKIRENSQTTENFQNKTIFRDHRIRQMSIMRKRENTVKYPIEGLRKRKFPRSWSASLSRYSRDLLFTRRMPKKFFSEKGVCSSSGSA